MSFWAGIILKRGVILAADSRRVYPDKGAFEDGHENVIRINEHTWLAAAGHFPVAGVVAGRTVEAFRQVFAEGKVDLTMLLESEAVVRDLLTQIYDQIRGESQPAIDLLLGGISSGEVPYLIPVSSGALFRPRIVRDPFATVCVNFDEPLQGKIKDALAALKGRLTKEPLEERRVKAGEAALRQLLATVAAASDWVSAAGQMVHVGAKGSTTAALGQEPAKD